MPLIHIQTSAAAPVDPNPLLQEMSRRVASLLNKPERYVMVLLNAGVAMSFGGDGSPSCYVQLKSIGQLDGDRPRRISADLCALLSQTLGLRADRIYIAFEDVAPELWGWNGGTFG